MLKNRDQGLDLLRAMAIMMVLLLHAGYAVPQMPRIMGYVFAHGWVGVDLFFVLSGFLIGHQALHGPRLGSVMSQLHNFWARRWFRTFPLYFMVLFTYVVLKPLIFGRPFRGEVWPYFLFLQNYFPLTDLMYLILPDFTLGFYCPLYFFDYHIV